MKTSSASKWEHSFRNWHIPLTKGHLLLKDALVDMHVFLHGEFSSNHPMRPDDCIHIILGRGMLAHDEAFVLGFTLGSSKPVETFEDHMHSYPQDYDDAEYEIFQDGLSLAMSSHCPALDEVDYNRYLNININTIRQTLGISTDMLKAYYKQEAQRFPYAKESQRLIN